MRTAEETTLFQRRITPAPSATRLRWLIIFTLPVFLLSPVLHASPEWGLCPPFDFLEVPAATNLGQSTEVSADVLSGKLEESLHLQGNVVLDQSGRRIEASDVTITQSPRTISVMSGLRASDGEFDVKAQTALFNQDTKESTFTDVTYNYRPSHASGRASEISQSGNIVTLKNGSYSTCPSTSRAWQIRAREVVLDREEGFGTAKGAKFRIGGVPILYFPYVTFPIDDRRKTGFLFPVVGSGDATGLELSVPYYWNIAPQVDATFSPRYTSKRGILLENELRYLSETFAGNVQANYLPDDTESDDSRYLYALKHNGKIEDHWRYNLDGTTVSDDDYLNDFGNSLRLESISHLPRQGDIRYQHQGLSFLALARAYQTIDPNISRSSYPYRILPRLALGYRPLQDLYGLSLSLDSEYTDFRHDINEEGERIDLTPRISRRWETPGWFFQPALSMHYTYYTLEEEVIDRSVPLMTLDSGLFFERLTTRSNLQTLEPRLFYVHAPLRQQSDIPNFDTSEPDFSFSTLFRENRFTGRDRIGDANQLTVSLTSRHLDGETNEENWRISAGQIFYFEDRQVSLTDTEPDTSSRSSYAAELSYTPNKTWFGSGSIVVEDQLKTSELFSLVLGYRGENRELVNLEHIYRQDDLQQTSLSFGWPVGSRWRLLGRWLYSHDEKRDIDIIGGLEYESCCWKARLVGQHYVTADEDEYNDAISLQLVFKGLASVGEGSELLQQRISGYNPLDE